MRAGANDCNVRILLICGPGPAAAEMFRELDREAKMGPLAPPRIAAIAGRQGVQVGQSPLLSILPLACHR